MGRTACKSCGSTDFYYDTGTQVCKKCGNVMEESTIVAEITFGEGSNGAAMAFGKNVPAGSSGAGGSGQESRAQMTANGLAKIREVAGSMRLGPYIEEMARRTFQLCVANHFIKGRSSLRVAAVCLYISCRQQKTSHMLIDFSDKLRINVFELGATYTKLVRTLHLEGKLPLVDPAHYIGRFAALLEFGVDTQKVATDAARLVKRFDSDWLRVGRRPSGICGACLLLAARMNNFRRSVEEIVQVVKIADSTIKKRLEEFRNTPSGDLTVQDFRSLWLEEFADPPAFVKGKEKRLREEGGFEEDDIDGDAEGALGDGDTEETLERPTKKVRTGGMVNDFDDEAAVQLQTSNSTATMTTTSASASTLVPQDNELEPDYEPSSPIPNPVEEDAEFIQIADEVQSHLQMGEGFLSDSRVLPLYTPSSSSLAPESSLNPRSSQPPASDAHIEPQLQTSEEQVDKEPETEILDTLDDIPDDEVDKYLCTAEEVTRKTRLWVEFNLQYLENLAAKGLDEQSGVEPRRKRSKPSKPKDSSNPAGSTPAEATRNIMTKKKSISKRINYTNLNSLLGSDVLSISNNYSKSTSTPAKHKSKSRERRERDRNKSKRSESMGMTDEEFDGMFNTEDDVEPDEGNSRGDMFEGLQRIDDTSGYESDDYQQEA